MFLLQLNSHSGVLCAFVFFLFIVFFFFTLLLNWIGKMCWTLLFSFLLHLLFLDDNFLLNANEMRSAKRASGRLPSRWTWQKKKDKKKKKKVLITPLTWKRRWPINRRFCRCLFRDGKKSAERFGFLHSRFVSPSANWVDGKQEAAHAPSVTFFSPSQVCSSPKHVDGKNVMEVKLFAVFTVKYRDDAVPLGIVEPVGAENMKLLLIPTSCQTTL